MDKEAKAEEYFKDEVDEFGVSVWDEGKLHWARKGFEAGFEAGKQERDKEIIKKLRSWAKGELETMKKIHPCSDWDDQSEIFSLDDLLTELDSLENLSK